MFSERLPMLSVGTVAVVGVVMLAIRPRSVKLHRQIRGTVNVCRVRGDGHHDRPVPLLGIVVIRGQVVFLGLVVLDRESYWLVPIQYDGIAILVLKAAGRHAERQREIIVLRVQVLERLDTDDT